MKKIFCAAPLWSVALVFPAICFAAGVGNPRESCRDDAHSFCGGIQPGGGRIIHCLQDHYKELSDDCYNALQNIHEQGHGGGAPPASENDKNPPPSEDEQNGNDKEQ